MSGVEITLERVTANDESAVIVAIHAASGTEIAEGQLIFEFENSKTTQELHAPQSGVLIHDLVIGKAVAFGVPIARIAAQGEVVSAPVALMSASAPAGVEVAERPGFEPRFSAAALVLIEESGLQKSIFKQSFVTSEDVRALLSPGKAPPMPVDVARPVEAGPARPGGSETNFRKRAEIEALSAGAGQGMLSVLGVRLGQMPVARKAGDFFEGRITDLVIYEASRLMKKFPLLNASYDRGHVYLHEAVHAGLAIDGGGRLVVYGIENANEASLQELSATVMDAVGRYVEDTLSPRELTRATFTVTDLSADELDFVLPLLPRGQSCILGITHSTEDGFRIFAGFDHRVTEGRVVGIFLGELRERLLSFARASAVQAVAAACGFCGRPAAEAVGRSRQKGLLVVRDGTGQETLCCASCWNGW